jgi:hypothetical protein
MSFLTSVRVIVKEGQVEKYVDAVGKWKAPLDMNGYLAQTGDRSFCFTGIFKDKESLVQARPSMIAHLDTVRDNLEEISADLGVTDPVSGPVLVEKLNWCV